MTYFGRSPAMGEFGQGAEAGAPRLTPTAVANAVFVTTGVVTVLLGPVLPALSARWSLNDAQAGEFFTAQFLASTLGVGLSGLLVARFGYRLAVALGMLFMALGVGSLPLGSRWLGMAAVACFGVGLGLVIPACNLLVAEMNPACRASALSLLNFSWSAGAVACPFLLIPFERSGHVSAFFYAVAGCVLLVSLLLARVSVPDAGGTPEFPTRTTGGLLAMLHTPAAIALGMLFFVYIGTENAVGGWLASYAKRVMAHSGTLWVMTPSFFYGGLLAGRALASPILRRAPEMRVARACVAIAFLGLVALLVSHSMAEVLASAGAIGLGLAPVYPITISQLSSVFGSGATPLGSVMFMLAGFGGATIPWLVGATSVQTSSLKFGLAIPLAGCAVMLALYFRDWSRLDARGLADGE